MPVYFGHPVPATSKGKKPEVSSELKAKGINLLRCSPSDMNILGIPLALLSMWGIFKEYFAVILFSIMSKDTVSLFPSDLELSKVHPDPLPLQLPPLCVSLRNHDQNAIEFLGNNGFEQVEIRGSTFFLCSSVTRALVRKLISPECPAKLEENSFCPYRFVNLSSLYSALDILNLFSYACQAMSFSTTYNSSIGRSDFDRGSDNEEGGASMEVEEGEVGPAPSESKDSAHGIAQLFTPGTLNSLTSNVPKGDVDASCLLQRKSSSSTSEFTVEHSGFVMRYVPELANEDKTTVLSFIQTFLIWNLGNGLNDSLASFGQIRSSWGNLSSTDFGLTISHLAKCLWIAMDAQVSLMPLFDMGYYEGCVLQGESFSLSINNLLIRPLEKKDLVSEIGSLATHRNTLMKIVAIIHRELPEHTVSSKSVINMTALRETLLSITLTESAKEEIVALAKHLRFPARPWNVNHANIMKMIEIIRGLPVLTETTPIGPRGLFSKDMIVVALSCFGEGTCPSFMHANGTAIDLSGALPRPSREQGMVRDRPQRGQNQSNAGWTFAIRRVRYDEALGDLRTMLRTKQARSVTSSVARNLGCVVISGKSFGELFGALSDLASILSGTSELVRSLEDSKRGGDADNDDVIVSGGPRIKRVRV